MGTLGGGDGGGRPDNGGQPEGLPGLPPEWGTVVVPDDPAELATEAAEIRRELRRQNRRSAWRRRFGLGPRGDGERSSLGLPLLIMAIAIITTLTSLFAIAWPGLTRRPTPGTTATAVRTLPDVTLVDGAGVPVRIRDTLPAAILLVEECPCAQLVADTARAAPTGVSVVAVGRTAPTFPSPESGAAVRALADPTGALRTAVKIGGPAAGAASVVLVSRDGQIRHTALAAHSVDAFRTDLAGL